MRASASDCLPVAELSTAVDDVGIPTPHYQAGSRVISTDD